MTSSRPAFVPDTDASPTLRRVAVSGRRQNEQTRLFETVVLGEAWFHGWGVNYEEFENGPGNFTAAIVEWPDGKIELVFAENVQFADPILPEDQF
jgi:hypothetical protein